MAFDLAAVENTLVDVAHAAGRLIRSANPLIGATGSKKNSADLVTDTDRAVEALISSELKARYPHVSFLGEETAAGARLTPAPTFIIDPIDGTINFVHRFPNSCVSLALAIDREPVVGVVFNPFTNVLYSAVRGRGAYLNRSVPLPLARAGCHDSAPQPLVGLSRSLVGIEWGSDRSGPNWDTKLRTVARLLSSPAHESRGAMVHSIRTMGSAALAMCAVAAGVVDVYWDAGIWPWDVAAGWIIVKESGGIIVDANPGEWHPAVDARRHLAVRGSRDSIGQRELVNEFWSLVDGTFDYAY